MTGKHLARVAWHVSGRAIGTPAFDGATVYFNTGDHHIVALDAETGAERWRAPTGVTDPAPVVPSCVTTSAVVACGDQDVVAFNHAAGAASWRYHATAGYGPGNFDIQIRNGTVFAGSYGSGPLGTGMMYALDAATGAPVWVSGPLAGDPSGVNISCLSVDDDIVVAAFVRGTKPITGGVVALDVHTGAVRWITNFPKATPDSGAGGMGTALWQSRVYGSSSDGRIYELDRATGAVMSFFPGVGRAANSLNLPVGQDFRAITVSGGTLFADSFGIWVTAYDLAQHRERWRVASPVGSSNAQPIVTDGSTLFVVSAGGLIAALATSDGRVRWTAGSYSDGFTGTVALAPDRVFVSAINGFWAINK